MPNPITFRQSQLARQTPSQIIQLAFLSALLELTPLDQGGNSGQRYQLITKFLQEAARIVPMESIFFAIADCSSTVTAEKCAKAVISSNTLIPPSKLMRIGCRRAANKFAERFVYPQYYHRDLAVVPNRDLYSYSHTTRLNVTDTCLGNEFTGTTPYGGVDVIYEGLPHHDSYSYLHTRGLNVTDTTRLDDDYFEETTVRALCRPIHDYHTPSYENAFHVHGLSNYPVSSQHFNQHDFDYTVDDTSSKKQKQLYAQSHALRNELFPESLIQTQFRQEHAVSIHTSAYRHYSVGAFLSEVSHRLQSFTTHDLICGRNIGETYPISDCLSGTRSNNVLEPLPVILLKARQKLASLCIQHKASDKKIGTTSLGNCKMLETVNKIIEDNLNPCVTMLGGFMEQRIRIPLVNNSKDTAKAFATADTSGAVGVWALFALEKVDILQILDTRRSQSLVLQITDFIHGVLNADSARHLDIDKLSSYDGKLQFLLQGMSETVTCSSHYISYSLERELVRLCEQLEITTSTNVDEVIATWDEKFNQTALALVPISHRPLLARWLIWALNIYRLREGLAKYTTVGVIGLVNSGKSTLVKKLFQKEVRSNNYIDNVQGCSRVIPMIAFNRVNVCDCESYLVFS